jgi:uncharacterized protein (DUF58 family)
LRAQTASKKTKKKAALRFHTMGFFILLVIVLGFAAGEIRKELALTLTASVFLAVWLYCICMTLLLSAVYRGRARKISARISPRLLAAGDTAKLIFQGAEGRTRTFRFRFPGILVRYRAALQTLDGRIIQHEADPDFVSEKVHPFLFEVPERGAFFSSCDELAVFDVLGFFRFSFRIPQGEEPRILSTPRPAEETLPLHLSGGGNERRSEAHFERTDNLIEHRPYVPGDDPRRINWKLYSHGEELFVREGEPEPPPHSRVLILVDSETDPALFSPEKARRAVDMLCEHALAAALSCAESGMDVILGCSGGARRPANQAVYREIPAAEPESPAGSPEIPAEQAAQSPAALAAALAWPAALPLFSEHADLPAAEAEWGCLILTLPRISAGDAGLDRFLKNRKPGQQIDLIFLCVNENLDGPGNTCAAVYGQKAGIKARTFRGGALTRQLPA